MFSISVASNGYKWTHTYNMHGEEEGLPTLSPVGPSICRIEAADGVGAHFLVDECLAHLHIVCGGVKVVVNRSERG